MIIIPINSIIPNTVTITRARRQLSNPIRIRNPTRQMRMPTNSMLHNRHSPITRILSHSANRTNHPAKQSRLRQTITRTLHKLIKTITQNSRINTRARLILSHNINRRNKILVLPITVTHAIHQVQQRIMFNRRRQHVHTLRRLLTTMPSITSLRTKTTKAKTVTKPRPTRLPSQITSKPLRRHLINNTTTSKRNLHNRKTNVHSHDRYRRHNRHDNSLQPLRRTRSTPFLGELSNP